MSVVNEESLFSDEELFGNGKKQFINMYKNRVFFRF